jgi:tetratricopeptide (TPR) repeat protein
MARSLSFILLVVLLSGCTNLLPTKTSRLSDVLSIQDQAESAYRANDTQRAATLYLQLTKMVPLEADYWYMLGNTYVRAEDPDRAVQAYQQAIARNPNHSRAWHNLGIVRMRQARAAFVSSASTAKEGDPMYDMSTRLADALAQIGSPSSQMAAAPGPVVMAKPVARARPASRRKPGTADQP